MTFRTVRTLAGRVGIGLIAGLTVLGSNAAMAQSVPLAPGMVVAPLPGTDLMLEPDLAGPAQTFPFRFTIKNSAGKLVCMGYVEQMIVHSSSSNFFHFYYRIIKTEGPGAITYLRPSGFRTVPPSVALPLSVAYRSDLPLGIRPNSASRNIFGDAISFRFADPHISCAKHQWSAWLLIKPRADQVYFSAPTRIITSTGDMTFVKTYKAVH
jgi:hypothetical protein